MIKFFICGVVALSMAASARAQNALFSTIRFLPDTSNFMSQDSTYTTIRYLGTMPYSGPMTIYYTTDTISFSPVFVLDSVPLVNFFNQNDTVQITSSLLFDSLNGFVGGNNIVVVWSSGNAITPADSLHSPLYLKVLAGVSEHNPAASLVIYPTVTKDHIFIESQEEVILTTIFIADVSGRIIRVVSPVADKNNRIRINTSDLKSGIYFLDILLPDKQRIVSKFIKTG